MLEGEIREIDLVPRLIQMWREQFTGAIRFEHDGIIKIIYFKGGDVLSASTNDRADSVDEILMRAGKVSREHVKQALTKRKENETLGDALLNLGFITRKELTWARRIQVIGVIRSLGEWTGGTFTIVADYLPKREEGTIFPLPQLIVELIVTDGDRPKYERLLESGSAVFEKAPGFHDEFPRLGLNEEAEAVVAQVDGARNTSDVASASGQETFNAYKLMHALSLLGLLRRAEAAAPVAVPSMSFEDAGAVSDAADVWSAQMPAFQLDDLPAVTPLPEPAPPPMPAWDIPPPSASPVAAPAPEPPAEPASEESSLAIDLGPVAMPKPVAAPPVPPPAAKRLSSTSTAMRRPVLTPPPKKKKRSYFGLIVTLMIVFILAGLGYFGFKWYTERESATAVAVVTPVRPRPRPVVTQTVAPPAPAPVVTASAAPVPARVPVPVRPSPPPERATVPPAGGDLGSRYDAMAREAARTARGNFTVQFAIVCDPSNVTKALRSGGRDVWFVPIAIKGRSCYRMFWGHYDTREAGQRELATLPAALRESKPSVVAIPR